MARTVPKKKDLNSEPAFHVALSFAGEDRIYVAETAAVLKKMGLRVFYDKYEQVTLWGKNLYDHLATVYGKTSLYTVIFISKHYAKKLWTNHERQNAQAKAFIERQEYILPVRFDNTEISGIPLTIGYISLKDVSPKQLAKLIKEKIGFIRRESFFPDSPDLLLKGFGAKSAKEKELYSLIATDIFDDLSLMTPDERRLISLISMNSCPAGPAVDGDIHMNINTLSRLSGLVNREIIKTCSRLECLGFSYELTSHDKNTKKKDILRVKYNPLRLDPNRSGNLTYFVNGIFECLGDYLCSDCFFDAVERLDFSALSSLAGFPDSHKKA